MIRASIDIGSNSVLLLVANFENNKIKELARESRVTSLGKNLDKTNLFEVQSMEATFEALNDYLKICQSFKVEPSQVIVTATEASRVAKNAPEFFKKVLTEIGFKIQIITSKAEAELTSLGILQGTELTTPEIVILDIGGASTELIRIKSSTKSIMGSISMPVGSVRSIDWLEANIFTTHLQKIFNDFSIDLDHYQTAHLCSVAGTMTSLGNMHLKRKEFVEDDVHGMKLTSFDIDQLFKSYSDWSPEQLLAEFPFLGKRAQSIRGGLHLVYHLFHRLKIDETVISTFGLRYGSLYQGSLRDDQIFS